MRYSYMQALIIIIIIIIIIIRWTCRKVTSNLEFFGRLFFLLVLWRLQLYRDPYITARLDLSWINIIPNTYMLSMCQILSVLSSNE